MEIRKILHIGSYYGNVGDNIALLDLRKHLKIEDFYLEFYNHNFNTPLPSDINTYDIILIGGGGLIENTNTTKSNSEYKAEILPNDLINLRPKILIYCVGINYLNINEVLSDIGRDNLHALMDKSKLISFRNDGSFEIIKNIYSSYPIQHRIIEGVGPAFITDQYNSTKSKLINGFFNVGFGSDNSLLQDFASKAINNICTKYNLKIIPHSVKDFQYSILNGHQAMSRDVFIKYYSNNTELLEFYNRFDFGICMRGHSQLTTFCKNIPCIYLSKMDKVRNFCEKYNLLDYCVIFGEPNWHRVLQDKIDHLINDTNYRNNWYKIREYYYPSLRNSALDLIDAVKYEIINV